jgi:N-hydroxyarylamine O-acetyltransferase
VDVDGYLARLGLDRPSAPTLDWLSAAQRAHVERVPYSTIDIHVGRPGSIDPSECADRVERTGRTGYCLQLNGAFGALLSSLGYGVRRHRGHVWSTPGELLFEPYPNHLAMSVTVDDAEWFVDVGLGDAPYGPLPLVEGAYDQGPCRYDVERIEVGWRFRHDPSGAFRGMDFEDAVARQEQFEWGHVEMSTSPTSTFVVNVIASRRDATGVDKLVNQTLMRVEGPRTVGWTLSSPAEFFAALADVYGLTLDDLDAEDRERLWRDAQAGQAAYEASVAAGAGHVSG